MRRLSLVGLGFALTLLTNGCFEVRSYPGPAPCASAKECDDGTVCTIDACEDGTCTHTPVEAMVPDDGNACTAYACLDGAETHVFASGDATCGQNDNLTCGPNGQCTGCAVPAQCGDDDACRTWTCASSACVAVPSSAGTACPGDGICDGRGHCSRCNDGVQNGGETDVDCGGRCVDLVQGGKCALDKHCDVDADCANGVCSLGTCALE